MTKAKSKTPHETVIDKTEPSTVKSAATTDTAAVQNDSAAEGAAALDNLMGEGRQIEDTNELIAAAGAPKDTASMHGDFAPGTIHVADPYRARPTLRVKKLVPEAILPQYQSAGAACFDIHSLTVGHAAAGGSITCETGLAFEVPDGFVMLVFSRSGHGFKNDVRMANCVGVIDSDYRGELRVRLTNDHRRNDFEVRVGDRVAQAMLVPVDQWQIEEVEELSATARGTNGYGSTGA